MSQVGYLMLAIFILVALAAIFVISFVAYRRAPVPKGCEGIKINEENCSSCGNKDCSYYQKKGQE